MNAPAARRQPGWVLPAAVAAFALLWFAGLGYRHLIRTDEGRYAEIAREMLASGDWITPRSNGLKYFDKPPLQYWATAIFFWTFGTTEWAARLWTALTGFAGVLFTGYAAARLWDPRTGWLAAAMLAGTLEWAAMGHFSSLDMGLSAFLAAALACVALAQRATALPVRRGWMLAAWGAAALAVLSKGPVALLLPAEAIGLYMLWQRDWRFPARLHVVSGMALFLAVTAPWFILVARANPEFLRFFFIHEHLERYLTTVHGRDAPAWFFVPVLAAGLMPWTLALPAAIRAGWQAESGRFSPERLLLAWAAVVFVFFSLSHSKLESYILPMYPALAMLLARALGRPDGPCPVPRLAPVALIGIGIAIAAPIAFGRPHGDLDPALAGRYVPWLMGAGTALAAGALGVWLLERRGERGAGLAGMALGGLLAAQLALLGHESLSSVYSSYHIARLTRPYLDADTPFYAVDTYDHTLPFYTGRTMTMVAYQDELSAGIASEPQKFIHDLATFATRWRDGDRAVAFMTPRQYDAFAAQGLPMTLVARDSRRVIVRRR